MESSQIGVAIAQILVFLVNALLYARQKSALDIEKRDRGIFGVKVSDVERVARDASSAITHLTFEHYEALRQKVEALSFTVRELTQENLSLKESVKSLSNKLASRNRADTAAFTRAARAGRVDETDEEKDDSGHGDPVDPIADLIANGSAIQLRPREAEPAATQLPNHFGQGAGRKRA